MSCSGKSEGWSAGGCTLSMCCRASLSNSISATNLPTVNAQTHPPASSPFRTHLHLPPRSLLSPSSRPPHPLTLTLLSRRQIAGCTDDPHQKKGVVISERHPQQVMSLRYRKSGSSLFITRGHLVLPQFMRCS